MSYHHISEWTVSRAQRVHFQTQSHRSCRQMLLYRGVGHFVGAVILRTLDKRETCPSDNSDQVEKTCTTYKFFALLHRPQVGI